MPDLFGTFGPVESWLATSVLGPLFLALGFAPGTGDPYEAAQFLLVAGLEVACIALILRPLEFLAPLEIWPDRRRARIDVLYTLLKLLVLSPVLSFVAIPAAASALGVHGDTAGGWHLGLAVPWLGENPAVLFLVYAAIFDFTLYVVHRLQHAVPWWWALHSLHHSQTQLNCWSNDRDSLLDDVLESAIVGAVAYLVGVPPVSYALIALVLALVECFSHANVRFGFGPVLNKLLVEPHYHRNHHMIADPNAPGRENCNFAFIFPVWDIVLGTALYDRTDRPTGVDDPEIDGFNELGYLGQQAACVARAWRVIATMRRTPERDEQAGRALSSP